MNQQIIDTLNQERDRGLSIVKDLVTKHRQGRSLFDVWSLAPKRPAAAPDQVEATQQASAVVHPAPEIPAIRESVNDGIRTVVVDGVEYEAISIGKHLLTPDYASGSSLLNTHRVLTR